MKRTETAIAILAENNRRITESVEAINHKYLETVLENAGLRETLEYATDEIAYLKDRISFLERTENKYFLLKYGVDLNDTDDRDGDVAELYDIEGENERECKRLEALIGDRYCPECDHFTFDPVLEVCSNCGYEPDNFDDEDEFNFDGEDLVFIEDEPEEYFND